ncbi:MAG: hypothetical protein J6Y97_02220, partial [Prevotella sp.]|nr:hypothetical protein [Prevotella sp.]
PFPPFIVICNPDAQKCGFARSSGFAIPMPQKCGFARSSGFVIPIPKNRDLPLGFAAFTRRV